MQCFHCGEEADSHPPITLELDGLTREFCCYGCRSVCETIHQEGLTGFYQHRTAPAVTPKSLTATELEQIRELDHPLVQQTFVQPVKGGLEAQLLIEGITCAACIWLLENHLSRQPGVLSFSVNHTTQRARLVWSPDQVHLSQLVTAIHELGYAARPYKADEVELALKAEKRSALIRLSVAGIGMVQSMMLAFPLYFELVNDLSPTFIQFFRWFSLLVATPVVLYSARPFFRNALRDIRTRHLTMDVPVATAIGLAYLASAWVTIVGGQEVYFESVCMFTFLLSLGRYIEMQARYRAGLTGNALVGVQPRVASRRLGDQVDLIATHELKAGDIIVVKPGETLPVDGTIIAGHSTINEAALTGEYLPETRSTGDYVHAGSLNGESPLDVRVEKTGASTRLSGILRILDRVQSEKPAVARMADRVAGMFVSRILILAPLVWVGWWLAGSDRAFDITLSVLVVTCPCALSLATPTAITSATVKLRKLGFLPTRGHTLESLNTIDTVVFDKTGTLTEGKLSLVGTHVLGSLNENEALNLAAGLEQHSEHPIAKAFSGFRPEPLTDFHNHVGGGLTATWRGNQVAIGHSDFVGGHTSAPKPDLETGHGIAIWMADSSQWLACFVLDDRPRDDAHEALATLHAMGIHTVLLSGDRSGHVAHISKLLGLDEAYGQATPEDKLARLKSMQDQGRHIMMVGDGLNDLPSMAGSSVSVAMGSAADLTQLRADAVLLNGQLRQLPEAIRTGIATRKVIRQNMAWALTYNLCALPLAAAGIIPPWLAAIGMSLSSLVVVLNALRLGRDAPTPGNNPTLAANLELPRA
ncbi:heavy metal translocating P-type ATPase [Marinobacter zhejiangensis]|uniref:Cu2+-exporting ATPase n=1 Tax=Marinobacter zhejiangensis TaxID=488535 RepID=A0A1I4RG48_9GAMM|nr:heavy metal translocating P-type ATPase [Marinobacter zhejiangensis]SFM51026.1 Cu2+-exporting ATPase [Marinobacter zhejiangensis]